VAADEKLQLATALTAYLLEDGFESVKRFTNFLNHNIGKPQTSGVESLFSLLRSIWVDPKAAEAVVNVVNSTMKASLNGKQVKKYTAYRYVERAWPSSKGYQVINIADTSVVY